MNDVQPVLDDSWLKALDEQFKRPYFAALRSFLNEEKKQYTIYPPSNFIFAALNASKFDDVKVVIIGQDPYHGANQANGLSFSVNEGTKFPPSLKNIFKELVRDTKIEYPITGNLISWAEQGVLLLNATLTVRHSEANSHQGKGWGKFTDAIIEQLSQKQSGIVFLLWGRFAQNKASLIDHSKHHVLATSHPSPFSARHGFEGCSHFSKTNQILINQGLPPIDWSLNK